MHLGLQGWLLAFTPYGMDPSTRQWLRFLSPERFAIDSDGSELLLDRVLSAGPPLDDSGLADALDGAEA